MNIIPYLGILIFDIFGVWMFVKAAKRSFNPEKYISNQEREYSKILMRLFSLPERPLRGNRLVGYLHLFMAFLFWLAFLFHLTFFVIKLAGK